MQTTVDRTDFKRKLLRAVVLPIILLTALTAFFLWQINRLVEATRWVGHTDRVIAEANETQKLLLDLETGTRGYLITGDPAFLEPFNAGQREIEPTFDRLSALVSDNPAQVAKLSEVRALATRWNDYSREVRTLRDAGGDYASRVREKTGKNLMDEVRTHLSSFVAAEEELRDARTAATNRTTRNATLTAILATLLLGGILAYSSRRELVTLSSTYTGAITSEKEGREHLRVTLASIGDAVIATDNAGRVTFMNEVARDLTKWDEQEAHGRSSEEVFNIVNEETREQVESPVVRVLREGVIVGLANHTKLIARDGTEIFIDDSGAPIKDEAGRVIGAVLVFRDITKRRTADAEQARLRDEQATMREEQARLQSERLALQDELVRVQAERLAELSTPLIPVTDEIVIMPLIGTVDSERAQQVLEAISQGVVSRGARFAIIDITGVQTVDTHVAATLINAAQTVRLLGAEVVLTGIRPRVAQTLIGLGVNFTGLATRSTLQRGINYALERLRDGNLQSASLQPASQGKDARSSSSANTLYSIAGELDGERAS